MAVGKGRKAYRPNRSHSNIPPTAPGGKDAPAKPASILKYQGSDGVETYEELFVPGSEVTGDERKKSQSGSVLSGGSISDCSMTHVEQEYTQKELQEVMGKMKNMRV